MSDSAIQRLLTVMRSLRDPQTGCDWDKKQTIASIAPSTIEESYEVLDAIERQDFNDLREELGDLLYHIVFYAEIAAEQGLFNFDDLCNAASDKLERRHPHIFAQQNRPTFSPDWEVLKGQERATKQQFSVLDDIPLALPALMRAHKIQTRCSTVGFDWSTLGPVLDKIYEEIDEVMHEATQIVVEESKLEEELGDMLFAMVNFSRHLGHQAETALQKANRKFERRFQQVEQLVQRSGKKMADVSLAEMDGYWQQIKLQEKNINLD